MKRRDESKFVSVIRKIGEKGVETILSGVGDATKAAIGAILMRMLQ